MAGGEDYSRPFEPCTRYDYQSERVSAQGVIEAITGGLQDVRIVP
jgi:hypothetical protein